MARTRHFLALAGLLVLSTELAPARAQTALPVADFGLCLQYTGSMEQSYGIPSGLLTAIATAETGQRNPVTGTLAPWPWTINVDGTGRYFASKAEAVRETSQLVEGGARNIDVGCMQISLRHHPGAFQSLDQAFTPSVNVAYGARFLAGLKEERGTWQAAIEFYHSADPERRVAYRNRVVNFWSGGGQLFVGNLLRRRDDDPLIEAAQSFADGDAKASLDAYNRILDRRPDDALALLGRALSLEKLGRKDEAMAGFDALIVLDPDNPVALHRLAEHASGLPGGEGVERLRRLASIAPSRAEFPALLADRLAAGGAAEEALDYMARAARLSPENPIYLLNTAVLLDRLGRRRGALEVYGRFLDLQRRNPAPLTVPVEHIGERVRFLRQAISAG